MADTKNPAGTDGMQSVSALGLRWAALRGMLTSPLIMLEDQRSLREELVHELSSIERGFIALQARNATEVSAKIDIAKSAVRDGLQSGSEWLIDLLSSIQSDLLATAAKSSSPAGRATPHLMRAEPARNTSHAASESDASSAA
ncbi:hypothetical protein [Microvirga flavescens]|uniref:hypothetical protein n=1 Tax=Microvirga flavescens TaxID=2249811 RepID=UPI0013002E60|nr:hypothetical protein [Microvirga flavescens]